MDESFRKAVRSAVEQINPMVSRSCPLLDLAHRILNSQEEKRPTLERFVLYSKAPPAMKHVNQLLFISAHTPSHGDRPSSQTSKHDAVDSFIAFFAPQSVDFSTWAADDNIFDEAEYEYFISPEKDDQVDDVLRKSLAQAAKQLEEQFGSLSPSPKELLMQIYATATNPTNSIPLDEASIDAAFTKAIEAALVKFIQSDEKSSLQLMEFVIAAVDEDSTIDSSVKMAIAERIVFSSMPYPEASAGSDALSICLYDAVVRVESELDVEFPVEAVMAAIERLPAEKEVRLLLQQVIIGMIEKPQLGFGIATIGMKIKFKVPRSTTGQGVTQGHVSVSPTLFRRIVNAYSRKN